MSPPSTDYIDQFCCSGKVPCPDNLLVRWCRIEDDLSYAKSLPSIVTGCFIQAHLLFRRKSYRCLITLGTSTLYFHSTNKSSNNIICSFCSVNKSTTRAPLSPLVTPRRQWDLVTDFFFGGSRRALSRMALIATWVGCLLTDQILCLKPWIYFDGGPRPKIFTRYFYNSSICMCFAMLMSYSCWFQMIFSLAWLVCYERDAQSGDANKDCLSSQSMDICMLWNPLNWRRELFFYAYLQPQLL